MTESRDDPTFVRAWLGFAGRVAIALLAWLGFPALSVPGAGLFRRAMGRPMSAGEAVVLGLALMSLAVVAWLRVVLWRCPRCRRPFHFKGYTNVFVRRCLHCGLRAWSFSPGPDVPIPPFRIPARSHDIECELLLVATAAGGRESPVFSGYRGQIHHDGRDWDALWAFRYKDVVRPGEHAAARVWLLSLDAAHERLAPGTSFEVREGRKVIATGVVTAALASGPA